MANSGESQWQRQGRPDLEKPSFNGNVHDRYVKLLNFEMVVMNILETKVYELNDEEKVQIRRNCLGWEGLQLIKIFTKEEKEKCKMAKGLFLILSRKSNCATTE